MNVPFLDCIPIEKRVQAVVDLSSYQKYNYPDNPLSVRITKTGIYINAPEWEEQKIIDLNREMADNKEIASGKKRGSDRG